MLPMTQWSRSCDLLAGQSTYLHRGGPAGSRCLRRSLLDLVDTKSSALRTAKISAVRPSNARPARQLQLGPLHLFLTRVESTMIWDGSTDKKRPTFALRRDSAIHINVMDILVHYLQQHSFLANDMLHNVAVVPPSIYEDVLRWPRSCHLTAVREVWQHDVLPTYIVLPVFHDAHWFIWRGAVGQTDGFGWECDLRYLSSLGRPPQCILDVRANGARAVVGALFPQLKRVRTHHHYINKFKQARGSLDCGLFAAQALSAFLFERPGALEIPLPAAQVKQRIKIVLNAYESGTLDRMSKELIPRQVCLLHNHSGSDQDPWPPSVTEEQNILHTLPSLFPLVRRAPA